MEKTVLRVADLLLDRINRTVQRGNGRVSQLTAKEFRLLDYLMGNVGRTVSRDEILEHVWNLPGKTASNIVDLYVNYVREKVDVGFEPTLITTIPGARYRLRAG